jgi:hypothetical protein
MMVRDIERFMRLTVYISKEEYEALYNAGVRDIRPMQDEIRYLLREQLIQMGLFQGDNDVVVGSNTTNAADRILNLE